MAKLYGKNPAVDFKADNLMSFGKSFSRLNGQPLDKSEIWYNDLEALKAYAKTDAAYVGQKVVYIETNEDGTGVVTHYSIEVDGSLKRVGNQEAIDNINALLNGKDGATGLIARVETLEDTTYTSEQVDKAIADAIAAAPHLKREIVETLPAVTDADLNTIYMVPVAADDKEEFDSYDEYMVVEVNGARSLEKVGSWKVDLSNYATTSDVDGVSQKADGIASNLANEITRAKAAEEANAQAAAAAQTTASTASTNANLALNQITELQGEVATKVEQIYSKVPVIDENSGKLLTEDEFAAGKFFVKRNNEYVVAHEYSAEETYYEQAKDEDGALAYTEVAHTLLTPEEKEKLNSLVIGEDGGVEISGTVNIQNVQGLNGYLTEEHFHPTVNTKLNYITTTDDNFKVAGGKLSFTPAGGRLLTAEDETQLHFIDAVDTTTFEVKPVVIGQDGDGKNITKNTLHLISVSADALKPALGDLSKLPTIKVGDTTSNTVVDNINNIYDILTWGEMTV